MIAINDCFILQSAVFRILKRYFAGHDCYLSILHLFLDCKYRTELGQLMDLATATGATLNAGVARKVPGLEKFTIDVYQKIVRFKTAYYSFYLPVVAALTAV